MSRRGIVLKGRRGIVLKGRRGFVLKGRRGIVLKGRRGIVLVKLLQYCCFTLAQSLAAHWWVGYPGS